MSDEAQMPDAYLGDGLYLSHDGWHIWLAANTPLNRTVALEPAVFGALVDYIARHPGPFRDELLRKIGRLSLTESV